MSPNYADFPEALIWVDVETTGLKPHQGERLLEVAALVTDRDLNLLDEDGYQATVYIGTPDEATVVRDAAVPFVQDMHDRTGLWDRVSDRKLAKPLATIDAELVQYVKQFAPVPRSSRLAGNSVRLDLNFVDEYLPGLAEHLHYRMFDVTSISSAARWWTDFPEFEKAKAHAAFDDIRESLAEARAVRDHARAMRDVRRRA